VHPIEATEGVGFTARGQRDNPRGTQRFATQPRDWSAFFRLAYLGAPGGAESAARARTDL